MVLCYGSPSKQLPSYRCYRLSGPLHASKLMRGASDSSSKSSCCWPCSLPFCSPSPLLCWTSRHSALKTWCVCHLAWCPWRESVYAALVLCPLEFKGEEGAKQEEVEGPLGCTAIIFASHSLISIGLELGLKS